MRVWPLPYAVFVCCWFVAEMSLLVRDLVRRRTGRRDRGTRLLLALTFYVSIVLSWALPHRLSSLDLPGPRVLATAGLVVVWAGLALRIWAVATLGRSFRTFIDVDADQAVVRSGPYRWVRHPSYTGLLLIAFGFGLGSGNGLTLVASALIPVSAIMVRIAVEETELVRVLGEPYVDYQRSTRRLVPGLW